MHPRSELLFLTIAFVLLSYLLLSGGGTIPDFIPVLRPVLWVIAGGATLVLALAQISKR
jgi:hypothetical protein